MEESIIHRTHKFEFRPDHRKGMWYQLGSDKVCISGLYYKYSDGKNWSEFTREELEYMATQSCADVPRYIMAPEVSNGKKPTDNDKDLHELFDRLAKQPIRFMPSLLECTKLAATLPNGSLAELQDNARKVQRWLEGGV